MTEYNGTEISYDTIGNRETYNGYTYTWENGRQLASISGNNKTISYTYNADGIRTSKTVDGVLIGLPKEITECTDMKNLT